MLTDVADDADVCLTGLFFRLILSASSYKSAYICAPFLSQMFVKTDIISVIRFIS
jgi:hypothetical protein